nr:putative transcription factor sol4 [Quercus suber]
MRRSSLLHFIYSCCFRSSAIPMQADTDTVGPLAKRKRPMISCRECHRRKEKSACVYELHDVHLASPAESGHQPTDSDIQCRSYPSLAASSAGDHDATPLGYSINPKGTSGIIRELGEPRSHLHTSRSCISTTAGQYTSLIRELPSRRHIDILVQDFFQNVAWHYDVIDEPTFRNQLAQWSLLSYRQLQLAPDGIPNSLQSFPALLFQVLAQALLFQPSRYDKRLDELKYTADMELCDKAAEYSHTGHRIATSFRKSELNLTAVQAELMRACFEKTTGSVVEAWHTLGAAIRDAQELGLHRIVPEQNLTFSNESSHHDHGRKVWLMLHLWDAHMGTVLGRPISTRINSNDVPFPTLWNYDSDAPRLPTPSDVILCGYHTAYRFLQDIQELERTEDYHILVEKIHGSLLTNISNLPSWAKPQRPRQHEPPWLFAALETMYTNVYFVLFALHRPFIFVESSSRARAYHAATQILESQARLFDKTEPLQHKGFGYVFATFDAMVLIMALHIRIQDEFVDQFPATKTNLEWSLERLKALRSENALASSAFDIAQRLYQRTLAAVTPTSTGPLYAHQNDAVSDNSTAVEAEMSCVDWEAVFQPNLEDILYPQPLNQLLYDGTLNINQAW